MSVSWNFPRSLGGILLIGMMLVACQSRVVPVDNANGPPSINAPTGTATRATTNISTPTPTPMATSTATATGTATLEPPATMLASLTPVATIAGNDLGQPTAVALIGCAQTSVGFVPLSDLGRGTYMGAEGGLYPGGSNNRPAAHEQAGQAIAQTIQPLAADGTPDLQNGSIVLLSLGMSNAGIEFTSFLRAARDDPASNPQLVIVNGAQGGWSSDKLYQNPGATYWQVIEERLARAGVTMAQVQIVWLKQARAGVKTEGFPEDAQIMQAHLQDIIQTAYGYFPQLKLAYLSNRIYGGYAKGPLNPEPFAYQTGFGVKWLIAAQIEGDPALNFDPAQGEVRAPWLSWGPDLWADGLTPRSDGLFWACEDFAGDGTHPGVNARQKVATMLLDFFKTDTTTTWFLAE